MPDPAIQNRAAGAIMGFKVAWSLLLGAVIICFIGSVYLATVASRSIAAPLATLADEAARVGVTHRGYLAEVLSAEVDQRASRRRARVANTAATTSTRAWPPSGSGSMGSRRRSSPAST